jgi:hypothetical protein
MPKRLPAKLYKYQCLNKQSLENLINRCIYFSTPDNFNDPFDCKETINFDRPENIEFIELWKDRRKQVLQHMGVACFSATNANILLWSHYADKHMGFCLEFDRKFDPFNKAERITYAREYGVVPANLLLKKRDDPEFQEKAHELWSDKITKSPCWIYEREWRIFDKPNKFFPYDQSALTGVYFGYRMPEEDKRTIYKILEGTKTKFYYMDRSNKEFKVIPEPYKFVV